MHDDNLVHGIVGAFDLNTVYEIYHPSSQPNPSSALVAPPALDSGYVGPLHFVDSATIIANRYIRIDDSPYLQIVEVRLM